MHIVCRCKPHTEHRCSSHKMSVSLYAMVRTTSCFSSLFGSSTRSGIASDMPSNSGQRLSPSVKAALSGKYINANTRATSITSPLVTNETQPVTRVYVTSGTAPAKAVGPDSE